MTKAGARQFAPNDPAELYNAEYYRSHLGPLPYARETPGIVNFFSTIADHLTRSLNPKTVLDAGCAMGFLVESLWDRGVEAWGFDISPYAISQVRLDIQPYCSVASVADPIQGRYDLITCIEVLEHVSEEAALQAIENFTKATDTILFSSSPNDFGEPTHVSVRQPMWWLTRFAALGFYPDFVYDCTFVSPQAMLLRKSAQPQSYEALRLFSNLVRFQVRAITAESGVHECNAAAREMEQALASARAQAAGLNEAVERLNGDIAQRTQELAAAQQQAAAAAQEAQQALAASREQTAGLTGEVSRLNGDIAQRTQELAAAQQQAAAAAQEAQQALAASREQTAGLTGDVSRLNGDIAQRTQELAAAQQQAAAAEERIGQLSTAAQEAQQALAASREQAAGLTGEVSRLNALIEQLNEQISGHANEITQWEKRAMAAQEVKEQPEIARLLTEMDRLRGEYLQQEKQLADLQKQVHAWDTSERERANLSADMAKVRQAFAVLSTRQEDFEARAEAAMAESERARELAERAEQRNAILLQQIEEAVATIAELRQSVAMQNSRWEHHFNSQRSVSFNVENRYGQLSSALQSIEPRVAVTQTRVEELTRLNIALHQQVHGLSIQLRDILQSRIWRGLVRLGAIILKLTGRKP
jgi:2-polyprenyl-3-methyl-5-hydroxy-6-metoxy-1,4-benzoquinol methylase/chromosome segregation ATPase